MNPFASLAEPLPGIDDPGFAEATTPELERALKDRIKAGGADTNAVR